MPKRKARRLLNQIETAERFKVTTRTIYNWRLAGCPCRVQFSGEVLLDPEEVAKWLKSKEVRQT